MSVFKQLRHRRLGQAEALLDREVDSIERLLYDEAYQNTFLPPGVAARVAEGEGVDRRPGALGEFGFDPRNPVPVNGALGALTYLSRLENEHGQRLLFQCLGGEDSLVFEAVCYRGEQWYLLFVDIFHPRKSTQCPAGFSFSADVAMFSGFADLSQRFPQDYAERVAGLSTALQAAYAPPSRFAERLGGRLDRPLGHWAKLEALAARGLI